MEITNEQLLETVKRLEAKLAAKKAKAKADKKATAKLLKLAETNSFKEWAE